MRTWILAAAVLPAWAATAAADTVTIVTQPDYNPGGTFDVGVYLPDIGALGGYRLDVVFTTTVPVSGLLSVAPPTAAVGDYVSPDSSGFMGTTSENGFEYRVTLTDTFNDPPFPNVREGETNHVTTLLVTTDSTLRGDITVSIDPATFQVASFDDTFVDPPGPSVIAQGDPLPGEPSGNPVPAPPGVLCAAVAGLALLGRRAVRGKPSR